MASIASTFSTCKVNMKIRHLYLQRSNRKLDSMVRYRIRSSGVFVNRAAFTTTRTSARLDTMPIRMQMEKTLVNNYYQTAISLANFSSGSSQSFPDWWPKDATMQKNVALMDHIAHVVVPKVETLEPGVNLTLQCKDVIQWVLNETYQNIEVESYNDYHGYYSPTRTEEWEAGEHVSNSSHVLDPAYRHDPSTLPKPSKLNSNLNPMELLALGSVWHLPVSAAPPGIDRFDSSNGIKPHRLAVGDGNLTLHEGDYLRIHFDPRRFLETNNWNWGCNVGTVENGKPGVIVARDDDVGYVIIDKPSNVPVHARVDNLLENVASAVGRSLWLQRKNILTFDANALKSMPQSHQRSKKNKQKQKIDPIIYVATPQRLDQNTTGLLVVATKKSFASYFAKLLRTKVKVQNLIRGLTSLA